MLFAPVVILETQPQASSWLFAVLAVVLNTTSIIGASADVMPVTATVWVYGAALLQLVGIVTL